MNAQAATDVPIVAEPDSPPSKKLPPGEWMKKNLFSTPFNSLLTLIIGAFIAVAAFLAIKWIIDAEFAIVRANLANFMAGRFPRDELWRLWGSGYVFLLATGLATGAIARSAHELALVQDLPTEKEPLSSLLRRFWAILAVIVFFVSFARTTLPYIGVVGIVVVAVVAREIGWQLPAPVRRSAAFIGLTLAVVSVLIIAGTSNLAGLILGLITFAWVATELGRRVVAAGPIGTASRIGPALLAAIIVWFGVRSIGIDGYGWDEWGGIHITLFTAFVGIAAGLPVGIILALGRRSNLPVLKSASVLVIEFVRGVPLISLLLFSQLMLPLFLPRDFERPANLTLAIFVIMFFSAAYIAEIVRGGLQAVPKGQTEAAQASGMSAFNVQRLIVLPQALRAVIPAMVGQFIALFKDTSLLSIIGISELLRISDISNAQPDFVGKGLAGVTYLFVALGYWAFASTLSKESRRLEAKLGVGSR